MQLYEASISHGWGGTLLISSSEPRSGLFPPGIIYSSNIHKTKVIHHLPPGHATDSIFLSKQTTKLCIFESLWVVGLPLLPQNLPS